MYTAVGVYKTPGTPDVLGCNKFLIQLLDIRYAPLFSLHDS